MKVFISYHRADTSFRKKTENILKSHNVDFYAVPEDANFNGKSQQVIEKFLLNKLKQCDVLLCLIGKETFSRPHVDREIHMALRGEVGERMGIIGVHLPTRDDKLTAIDLNTFPKKLYDNKDYVVWTSWNELNRSINNLIGLAIERLNDSKLQTSHKNPCLPLKSKIYFDN